MIKLINEVYTYVMIEENGGDFFRESRLYFIDGHWELSQTTCEGSSAVYLNYKNALILVREWENLPCIRMGRQIEYRSVD